MISLLKHLFMLIGLNLNIYIFIKKVINLTIIVVSCRLILAEFGLFFHKLILRCRKFVSLISPIFEFVLTADNVDLNGVLDFEDYTPIAKRKTNDILINDIMAPLYHIFFSMYICIIMLVAILSLPLFMSVLLMIFSPILSMPSTT